MQTKQNDEFITHSINLDSNDNVDNTTSGLTEAIPKVFYCFDQTGCFKERDDFSLYLFPPDNK